MVARNGYVVEARIIRGGTRYETPSKKEPPQLGKGPGGIRLSGLMRRNARRTPGAGLTRIVDGLMPEGNATAPVTPRVYRLRL